MALADAFPELAPSIDAQLREDGVERHTSKPPALSAGAAHEANVSKRDGDGQ